MKSLNDLTHRATAQNLCLVLFDYNRSIWGSVLPYCFLNCLIMSIVEVLRYFEIKIAFSMNGHNLMTLLISYLVVAKINLSYDRYMKARHHIGVALSSLRELCQLVVVNTMMMESNNHNNKIINVNNSNNNSNKNSNNNNNTNNVNTIDEEGDPDVLLMKEWQQEAIGRCIDLINCTIRVLQNDIQSSYLARNAYLELHQHDTNDDPLNYVQILRTVIYKADDHLPLLERVKLVDMLNEYVRSYRVLLELASTPMPFQLVQMARTFLFLWTFTIPFTLRGVVQEYYVAMVFVFFLTYGFIGLEIVSMKLMFPFGDEVCDLNIRGMRDATIRGIQSDLHLAGQVIPQSILLSERRFYDLPEYSKLSKNNNNNFGAWKKIPKTTSSSLRSRSGDDSEYSCEAAYAAMEYT